MTVRTRFAPSPTGYLHIGGARTALFSWIYARKHGGQFVLRIEDTDLERSTLESVNAILEGMTWLGLDYDEGPFYQSQRMDRYQQVIQSLLDENKAYYCYCTKEELESLRSDQIARKEKPRYNGRCRDRTEPRAGVNPVVRFRNPDDGKVVFHDLIRGEIEFNNQELDDLIIARSDGSPTYNLTVVVDDLDMEIDYIIRGDDHINNTPRQINLIQAIGGDPPHYAHAPMILGADGGRLSKRHGAVSVMQYREDGFLPEALLNYLVRLGWSYGDQEIFSVEEMIERFEIKDINFSASTFNPDKLVWLNHHYIMNSDPAHVAHHLSWHLGSLGIDPSTGPSMVEVVKAQRERCKTLVEMAQASEYFYREFDDYDEKAAKKNLKPAALPILQRLHQDFSDSPGWQKDELHGVVEIVAENLNLKFGKVAQPLRVAVCGTAMSPSIDITLVLLGKDRTLARIKRAIAKIESEP